MNVGDASSLLLLTTSCYIMCDENILIGKMQTIVTKVIRRNFQVWYFFPITRDSDWEKLNWAFFLSIHNNLPGNNTKKRCTVGTCTHKSWAATFTVKPASSYKETIVLYMRKFSVRQWKCHRSFEFHVVQVPRLREVYLCALMLLYSNRSNRVSSESMGELVEKIC